MYITRHLEMQIINASKYYPVVMVCGQRQVGKSTMLNHLKTPERRYITLDDANARRLAEQDPALFFEAYPPPLLIDEVQRVPSLLLEIKKIIDQKALNGEDNNGMFWLTGSQKFSLLQGAAESLAGRIAIFEMAGLSAAEISGQPPRLFSADLTQLKQQAKHAQAPNLQQIYERIFRGSMPKLAATELETERFYTDYANTYLERDIRNLGQVGKLNEFYSFLVYMAARTAQELKYSDIANTIGISAPTAKAWTAILERSGIIYLLHPYSGNITSRLVKTPKIYFMDTGLAAYLCRWPNAATLANGAMDGAFFETYVITEIVKSYYNAGKRPNLYYYRDTEKREIDLLIVEAEKLYPIEIKKGKMPAHADKNFSLLDKFKLEVQTALIVCMSDELIPYSQKAWYCPVTLI